MSAQTLTTFDAALKQIYTRDEIQNMVYRDNPLLALTPKYTEFYGKNLPIPIIYANPQGRSATFSNAQGNKTPSKITDFVLTRDSDYALASIETETLLASSNDTGAFLEAATTEVDGAIHALTRSLAVAQYRDGSGSIGQVADSSIQTTFTVATIQLADANDVTNFEVGQEIQANNGSALRNSGASLTIVGVNRDSGLLTFDAAINSVITAIDNGDNLNVEGDFDSKIEGLDAWIPATAPDSTAFFGVDRSVDPTRLGGIRYDGSALPIEEALVEGLSRISREGGKPDHGFLNFDKFADLEKALGSKVQYVDLKANAEISFKGIMLNGPRGMVNILPDQNALSNTAFMLQMDMWKMYSLGDAPMIIDADGNRWLREASADSVEIRCVYYAQFGSRAPGYSGRVTLSS